MADIISTLTVIAIMVALAMSVAALLHVLRSGVRLTEEYLRGGVGLGTLLRGDLDQLDNGSLVPVREGLRASVDELGRVEIRDTRTIARDTL